MIQFSVGFFDLASLARLIRRLTDDGTAVYMFLHATADHALAGGVHLPDASTLRSARRLFVHSIHDLNRLKQLGLVANVTLFPFGIPAALRKNKTPGAGVAKRPVIATFGFLLPDKGLMQLIEAFALVRRGIPNADLLLLNGLFPGQEREREVCENAIRELGLLDCVTLRSDYLPEQDVIEQLGSADIVVYPYQRNRRSASAAVRLGLASLTPVATTPLTMFDDVASITHRLPGMEPHHMARGVAELLENPEHLDRYSGAQRAWVEMHSWNLLSCRFDALIRGEFFDGCVAS